LVAVVVGVFVVAGGSGSPAGAATTGWAGESILSNPATGDGWEPMVAADPAAPYVYSMYMQYSGTKVTDTIRASSDGGATFGAAHPICPLCPGGGQYDPWLGVSSAGAVDAVFMQQNN